jgi:uncharacterized protein YicC (UPF0701 family)
MRDPVYSSELDHDTSGASDREVEACMGGALTSVVEDLMQGEKVGGLTLQGLLEDEADLAEMVVASIVSRDRTVLEHEIERLLRHVLADSDAVHDRAVEIATGGDE